MRIHKIICLTVFQILLSSCIGVSQKEYDIIQRENKILKEDLEATRASVIDQKTLICNTISELAEVSNSIQVIRIEAEQGRARIKSADRISSNISAIKERINTLERQLGNEKEYKKLISSLKTIINEKEAEIKSLKAVIKTQKEKIVEQNTIITEQSTTINKQQQEIQKQLKELKVQQGLLQQALKEQAILLYEAAYEFEKLGSDIPDVSRKKNQKKVNEWAVDMLKISYRYYQKSKEYGVDATGDMKRVKAKISRLSK